MQFLEFEPVAPSRSPAEGTSPLVRLQYLIDNTPAIIYSSVPSGDFKMTFVSKNAYAVLGHRPEDMVADPNFWFDHIHPEDAPNIFSSLAQLFVEGERTYEYRFRNASGAYLWMRDQLRLIRDEHGMAVEVIGSLSDITARKQMEQEQQQLIQRLREAHDQLLQAEKMASIGQLAAGIAHEINNPIAFVNSNMGALQNYVARLMSTVDACHQAAQEAPASPLAARVGAIVAAADLDFLKQDLADLVDESRDGLKRVKDIVQALRDFSHVGETDWDSADVHAGLDSTLHIVANEIKYKATIEKRYGQLPPVTCLASQLNQVFMNLLVNAAQAIGERGVITIATGADGDRVWIAISDTGCGIEQHNLNRIFEPFFTTKPVGSGTGLGLSLSYSIVNKHGGCIEVESTPGAGTTFTVLLPVVPPASLRAEGK